MASLVTAVITVLLALSALSVFHTASQPALHNGQKSGLDTSPEVKEAARAARAVIGSAGAVVVAERLLNAMQLLPHVLIMRREDGAFGFPHAAEAAAATASASAIEAADARSIHPALLALTIMFDVASTSLLFTVLEGSAWAAARPWRSAKAIARGFAAASVLLLVLFSSARFLGAYSAAAETATLAGAVLTLLCSQIIRIMIVHQASRQELALAECARASCQRRFDPASEWKDRTVRSRLLLTFLSISYTDFVLYILTLILTVVGALSPWQHTIQSLVDAVLMLSKAVVLPSWFFYVAISSKIGAEAMFQSLAVRHEEQARIAAQKLIIRYVCHEVRVPLNSLAMGIELVGERLGVAADEDDAWDGDDPASPHGASGPDSLVLEADDLAACRETLHYMVAGTSAMRRILNDVLQVEAIEQGRITIVREPFQPQSLLRHVLESFGAEAGRRGVSLSGGVSYEGCEEGSRLVGDGDRLSQVCSNLVSNAIKFTGPGRGVRVRVRVEAQNDGGSSITQRQTVNPDGLPEPPSPIAGPPSVSGSAVSAVSPSGVFLPLAASRKRSSRSSASSARDAPGRLAVEVEDEGVGIDPGDVDKLFKPFHQLQSGARFKQHSTGLGLSICRGIVELHGGRIELRSAGVGHGSTFSFWVPVGVQRRSDSTLTGGVKWDAPAVARQPRAGVELFGSGSLSEGALGNDNGEGTASDSDGARLSTDAIPHISATIWTRPRGRGAAAARRAHTVLVVDDVPGNRLLLQRMVERLGHDVEGAENGREGVDRAVALLGRMPADGPPLVVMMDGNMPVLDGVSATRELMERAGRGRVVVVGVTGNAHAEDQEAFLRAGAVRVLMKPVSRAQVEAELARVQ